MKKSFFIIALILLIIGCNRTPKEATVSSPDDKAVEAKETAPENRSLFSEDFDKFYNKFHADSSYQMKRVNFPVEGFRITNQGEQIPWSKNNWMMHRIKISDVDTLKFEVKIEEKNNYRKEILYIEGSGFRTERVFKRINGKWYLVYFTDENL